MAPEVRVAATPAERDDAFAVRRRVFIEEQGVPEEVEMDDHEDEATHFVAYSEGKPVGAARLRRVGPGTGKVERVAVVERRRGDGIGRELMDSLESVAVERGFTDLVLHSQTRVEGFYERLGYETTSDVFEEAGIPHVKMEKSLTQTDGDA